MLLKSSQVNLLLLIVYILTLIHSLALPELPDDISVNCGSSGSSKNEHGRKWLGDIGSRFLVSSLGSKAKSIKSLATNPYLTARISRQQFHYGFHVSPGEKFIRLYFHPNAYPGFKRSNGFFTVKAGPFTLVNNFSASLTADSLGVKYFVKEFCVKVEENQPLIIAFSPSTEAYAFVNGIEIISMPPGLYYTSGGEPGAIVVGKNYQLEVDKSVALEMTHRLNVGGSFISSSEDIGLSREWSDDSNFFVNTDVRPVSTSIRIRYRSIPSYAAPLKVYQTSWDLGTKKTDKAYNFTWKLPVDLGFRYLIRFHFCELEYEIEESSRLRFSILINDQIAEPDADVIHWSGGSGVALFRDYVIRMEGDRMEGKKNLLISLIPMWSNNDEWWTGSTDTILKGLEVFKLSNIDKNLAGVNPIPLPNALSSTMRNPRKFVYARGESSISTVMIILILFVNIIVYQLRILGERDGCKNVASSSSEALSRPFSLAEVRSATNNFDELLVIGRGGFGLVYKGVINDGAITVAIKRLNSESKQGAEEFWTEIDMLSNLRHTHLVSLIGYCDEGEEMILVYEYMQHGTLADHLYKNNNNGGSNSNLSWEQKLNICIGAARGLDYLHTGTRHGVIHRDVKTTNILLDNEWLAKISDFGLCKIGTTNQSRTHVSTNVKGTFGYMDPEYFMTRRLTMKSDVYAFGVVLLEVLCGRPAVDIRLREDRRSLALWAQHRFKEGKIDELMDPTLQDQISSPCLKIFTDLAYKCLHNRPMGRPTMSDVVVNLESALVSQNCNKERTSVQKEEEEESSVDDSEDELMFERVQLDGDPHQGPIPTPLTPVQELENTATTKKKSKGKLGKAFQWSFGLLTKKKNDHDSSSQQSGSESISDRFLLDTSNTPFRQFSIAEIRAATNNFNRNLKLGKGSFGVMYKGWIDCGTLEVAIKCTKLLNATELVRSRAEITAHSQLRHLHVISLIGCCADGDELMLVYSYMVNRSLEHQLYEKGNGQSPLPWTKRLEICIGAAKGLDYLHNGTTKKIIHRDIKPSNILLNENWVAKISAFELSKAAMLDCTHVTSCVRGTLGYLAPEYACHMQLTEKTDVYAFGVVLLEVVSARKPFDFSLDEEQQSLADWFRTCLWNREIDQIIDPYLIGRISPECLMQYLKVAYKCLHVKGAERPTMNYVVENLQIALQLQESWYLDADIDTSSQNWIPSIVGRAYNNVLEYQYGSYFENLHTYMSGDGLESAGPRFTDDISRASTIELTLPLR